jgi:hypothetical protein
MVDVRVELGTAADSVLLIGPHTVKRVVAVGAVMLSAGVWTAADETEGTSMGLGSAASTPLPPSLFPSTQTDGPGRS